MLSRKKKLINKTCPWHYRVVDQSKFFYEAIIFSSNKLYYDHIKFFFPSENWECTYLLFYCVQIQESILLIKYVYSKFMS